MKKIIIPCLLSLLSHSAFSAALLFPEAPLPPPVASSAHSQPQPTATWFSNISRNGTHFSAKIERLDGLSNFFLAHMFALEAEEEAESPREEYMVNIEKPATECLSSTFEDCHNISVVYKRMDSFPQATTEDFAILSLSEGLIELVIKNRTTFDSFLLSRTKPQESASSPSAENTIQEIISTENHVDTVGSQFSLCLFKSLLEDLSCVELYEHLARHLEPRVLDIPFDSLTRRGHWTIIGKAKELTGEVIRPLGKILIRGTPDTQSSDRLVTVLSTTAERENEATLNFYVEDNFIEGNPLLTSPYATLTLTPGVFELKIKKSGVLPHFINALEEQKTAYNALGSAINCNPDAPRSLPCILKGVFIFHSNQTNILLNFLHSMVKGALAPKRNEL